MRAIVLAAGLGKRMRPLTDAMPKPLVMVGDKPLIDHVLDWLLAASIHEVVVNTHYKAAMLEEHLQLRIKPHIRFSHEEDLLETGGGIMKALLLLGDAPFFAANSDTICVNGAKHALSRLAHAWDDEQMDALLLLHPVASAVGYDGAGDFHLEANGLLRRRGAHETAPFVFTGVQLLHPRFFIGAPDGAFSMNLLYDRNKYSNGELSRVRGLVHDGKWLHVGDPAAIALAEAALTH